MFGLGMPEILLILAIALIVIGPKKLPELAKTLGRAMGEFKRSAQDFKRSIDVETTVKDLTDLEGPETDLKDILKTANTKEDPSAADPSQTDSQDPETESADTMTDDIPDDTQSAGTDHPPEHKKND
jgi:Tat protein translocase TatB subunit